jgi:hypothetical protein
MARRKISEGFELSIAMILVRLIFAGRKRLMIV